MSSSAAAGPQRIPRIFRCRNAFGWSLCIATRPICSREHRLPTAIRASRSISTTSRCPTSGAGEALVAVMASSVNYNTVWSAVFEPLPTFRFLERYGRLSELAARHDLPYHVVGSDLAGAVLRTGPGVTIWRPADEVVAHCLHVEWEAADGHNDTMLDPAQRIWGYETNFGGLAELALVRSNQLMPKPHHLTWEEAAASGLVNSTAYRQLVSRNGADMKQGDLGCNGRIGFVRNTIGPRRRCISDLCSLVCREGMDLSYDGRRGDHRSCGRGLPLLVGRSTRCARVSPIRRTDSRADRR